MEIKNLTWDQKSLGRDVLEVNINADDKIDCINDALSKIRADYVVVKVPLLRYDVNEILANDGYVFIENIIEMYSSNQPELLTDDHKKKARDIIIKNFTGNNGDIEQVFAAIKSGNVFETDRIAIDTHYSKEIAGIRYYNWASDLMESDADIVLSYNGEKIISFSIIKKIDQHNFNALLWGVMPEYKGTGYGFIVPYSSLKYVSEMGGKTLHTSISSNNIPIFKLLSRHNFIVENEKYIFVKHNNN